MSTRRSFLGSVLALAAAPALVRTSSLMPVRAYDLHRFGHYTAGGLFIPDIAAEVVAEWARVTVPDTQNMWLCLHHARKIK